MDSVEFVYKLNQQPPIKMSEELFDQVIEKSIEASENKKTEPIGSGYNIMIAMEEMAELIQAASKFQRKGSVGVKDECYYNVLQEYADVIIAIKYIRDIVGLDEKDINRAIRVKVERLHNTLEKEGIYK